MLEEASWVLEVWVSPSMQVSASLFYSLNLATNSIKSKKISIRDSHGPLLQLLVGLQVVPCLTPSIVFQPPAREIRSFVYGFRSRGGRSICPFGRFAAFADAHCREFEGLYAFILWSEW